MTMPRNATGRHAQGNAPRFTCPARCAGGRSCLGMVVAATRRQRKGVA